MARRRRYVVCVIDDQSDEIERARTFLGNRFIVGAGTSIDAALADLRAQGYEKPDIFLLDLYHSSGPRGAGFEGELHSARTAFLSAEAKFLGKLAELRQTTEGGFGNLRELRRRYVFGQPPIVFFTRKGTIDNAIAAYAERVPLIKKPDPSTDEVVAADAEELPRMYDRAFENGAESVAATIEAAIHGSDFWRRYGQLIGIFIGLAFAVGLAANLVAFWLVGQSSGITGVAFALTFLVSVAVNIVWVFLLATGRA